MPQSGSFSQLVLLGGLESLLNQTLTGSPRGREQLAALHGTAIRIRTERPHGVFYLLIYEDGLELLGDYEGGVDIRVRGSLGKISHWLLNGGDDNSGDTIRISGDEARIEALAALVEQFSLWPLLRNWLDDHVRLKELLGILRREDPAWLERLAGLPQQVGELADQVAQQQLLQEDLLSELRSLRQELRNARRYDLGVVILGTLLIVLSLLKALGQWQFAWIALQQDLLSLGMLSLGIALLISRFLPKRIDT